MKQKRVIIIGAGLSGLYLASLLQKHYAITILEARDRVGGRIHTVDGHDLGPSWVWSHQKHILALISSLGLELFPQYTKGLALYDAPNGVQRFSPPPSAPAARIKGGIIRLVQALSKKMDENELHLDENVIAIKEKKDVVLVKSASREYEAEFVISTLPPRLAASSIGYDPPLDDDLLRQMRETPTWMGHSVKCVIEYKEPFWRASGLSGALFSHQGPLGEIHDACTQDHAALFGFLHSTAKTEDIEAVLIAQMVRLFGEQASKPTAIYITRI